MRPLAGLSALLLLVIVAGCDSDQPLEFASRNALLSFSATNARVAKYRVHMMFEDSDNPTCNSAIVPGDGQPDYGMFPWCDAQGPPNPPPSPQPVPPMYFTANSVPWPFDAEVRVLRAGSTVSEIVARSTIDGDTKARYDLSVATGTQAIGGSGQPLVHRRGFCTGDFETVCNPDVPTSFCTPLGLGICRRATGFCDGDPSRYCDVNIPSVATSCAVFGVGNCLPNPTGFCSNDPCFRCDVNNPGTICGAGTCTTDPPLPVNPPLTVCDQPGNACRVLRIFKWQPQYTEVTSANRMYGTDFTGKLPLHFVVAPNSVCSQSGNFCVTPAELLDRDQNFNAGRCPGFDSGPALIGGQPLPLAFQLNKGDTLIVEARRLFTTPTGIIFDPAATQPGLNATLTIDGLAAGVTGTTQQNDPGSEQFIDFHITLP